MMTVVVQPVNSSSVLEDNLSSDLRFIFRIRDVTDHTNPQCAFWDYSLG